ncbi:hypothetical protein BH20ACT5_BH20ACT5_01640 [soil metagenome]
MAPHRGRGRGGWQRAELPPADDAAGWFAGRLPDDWFTGPAQVTVDRDEITVVGTLSPVAVDGDAAATTAAALGRIERFREDTRDARMAIAAQAQHHYGRTVSWGARSGEVERLFTTAAVPVMTRLRQAERQVLDTLVDAGVARSRSDALVWSVRLVGEHAEAWLAQLRESMTEVDRLRKDGPDLG